jgi:hypothetical protein
MVTRPIAVLIAAAAIAGCSGAPTSQTAFTPAQPANAGRAKNWMSPDAKRQSQLLYVSDESNNLVDVYAYPPQHNQPPIGTLTGFDAPTGICSDTSGNVYILNGGGTTISVYAHGASTPLRTLSLPGSPQLNCTVDPKSGNLALGISASGVNGIAVFTKAQGIPLTFVPPNQQGIPGCAYDAKGNLFCDGYGSGAVFALYELARKGHNAQPVTVKGTYGLTAGPMQWDGRYITFGSGASGNIYEIASKRSGYSIGGSTILQGAGSVFQYWIQENRIVAPTYDGTDGSLVGTYAYPGGGISLQSIFGLTLPAGAAVSTAKK